MKIQPQEHLPMARDIIAKEGALVTEFPMTFPPNRHSFPMRNRIISALSLGTIVIEAGLHSGALITAAAALEQGKNVFAVPGNADSDMSSGCNNLIKSGEATLITGFEDVLEAMDFLPGLEPKDFFSAEEESAEECGSAGKRSENSGISQTGRGRIRQYFRRNRNRGGRTVA